MEAHEKGIKINYYPGAGKPHLVTTGDNRSVKIPQQIMRSMEGHTNNISFIPICPLSSVEAKVKRLKFGIAAPTESKIHPRAGLVFCPRKDANEVAVGFGEGVVIIKLGRDEPTYSMDSSCYTRNRNVFSGTLTVRSGDDAGVFATMSK